MLTSAFLHSQGFLLHIVLNMYTLWIFGQTLEPLLGQIRFLAVYLLSAIGGSVGYLLLTPVYPGAARWAWSVPPAPSSACSAPCWWSSATAAARPPALGPDRHQRRHRLHGPADRLAGPSGRPHHRRAVRRRHCLRPARPAAATCCRPEGWRWFWPCWPWLPGTGVLVASCQFDGPLTRPLPLMPLLPEAGAFSCPPSPPPPGTHDARRSFPQRLSTLLITYTAVSQVPAPGIPGCWGAADHFARFRPHLWITLTPCLVVKWTTLPEFGQSRAPWA